MKLAFSTNAFKNYALDEAISIISKLGYEGVEILCDVPHAYPGTMPEERIADIKNLISRKGISLS
ncbi:MAG TPA: sugar phosphate isomerase/epimerase, partial [Nitrososphaeraceae archaeon]|nr:sugar phosphate isomerase/epimerase [Nitrososphaeraceae archaeon]